MIDQEHECVTRRDFLAVLRMLVRRATPEDIALAEERPGHWLNMARAELQYGVVDSGQTSIH